jgi:hypothetical protein
MRNIDVSSDFFFRPDHIAMLAAIHVKQLAMNMATAILACDEDALRYRVRCDRLTERGLEPMSDAICNAHVRNSSWGSYRCLCIETVLFRVLLAFAMLSSYLHGPGGYGVDKRALTTLTTSCRE